MSSYRNNSSSSRRSRCRGGHMIELVKMYHGHRCLWDRSHPDYKIKAKRYQALKAIGVALNLSCLEDVKKKIKSMRDTYTAEKNRMKKSLRADSDEVYRTKLAWYRFADTFFNGTEVTPSEIKLSVPETIDDPLDREDEDCKVIPLYDNHYDTELVELEFDDQSTGESNEPVHRYSKNSSNHNANNQQEIPTNTTIEAELDDSVYAPAARDEFYYFGMNVASQLRTLPKINALVLQDRIHKLIFDERLQFEGHATFHQNHTETTVND